MGGRILSDEDVHIDKRPRVRRNPVSTTKLVDVNNAAQPGLTSQRKVIDDFCAAQVARDVHTSTKDAPLATPSSLDTISHQ